MVFELLSCSSLCSHVLSVLMDSWTDMTVQSTENTTMDNYTKSSFIADTWSATIYFPPCWE